MLDLGITIWQQVTGPRGAQAPAVVTNAFFFNDGSSLPLSTSSGGAASFYDTVGGLVWYFWEAEEAIYGAAQRIIKCCTVNPTTGVKSGPYIVGINDLPNNDNHGPGSAGMDANGFVYCGYGTHAGALKLASTPVARDPSRWQDLTDFGTTVIFQQFYLVNGTFYLLFNNSNENFLSVVTMTASTAGVPTWSAVNSWLQWAVSNWPLNAIIQINGTDIHYCCNHFNGATVGNDVFYFIFDTVTGNVKSFDGITVIVPGSQPISLATSQTSFRVVNMGTNVGSVPARYFDSANGLIHIIYSQSAPALGAAGPVTLLYINLTISNGAISSPQTIYTWPANTYNACYPRLALIPNGPGGITAVFTDGSVAGDANGSHSGNMLYLNRSSGGTWDVSPTTLQSIATFGLNEPQGIQTQGGVPAPPTSSQLIFCESAPDELTIEGNLQGFVYGSF